MASIPIIQFSIDEVKFIIDHLTTNIVQYGLYELTNENCGNLPNIIGAHPLAMEYGNLQNMDDEGNYSSILPAIGVELLNDNDHGQQYLGSGYKTFEISQDFIDTIEAVELKDRFTEGTVLTDTNLTAIQADKTTKGSEKLWAKSWKYLMGQQINVSCWSDNPDVTRILYIVLRSLLQKLKHIFAENGVRNTSLSGQGAIYNFEFNQTLYGAEFNINFINGHRDVEVDSTIETINQIDESKISPNEESRPTFKQKGE